MFGLELKEDIDGIAGVLDLTEAANFSLAREFLLQKASEQRPRGGLRASTATFPSSTDVDESSDDAKLCFLLEAFPTLSPNTISMQLQKAGGDLVRAQDVLLNLVVLHEGGEVPRGIDGFLVSDEEDDRAGDSNGGRRKRKKRKTPSPVDPSGPALPTPNGRLNLPYRLAKDNSLAEAQDHAGINPNGQRATPSTESPGSAAAAAASPTKAWSQIPGHEAEQYVQRNRTDTEIDLHHLAVADGVGIARRAVRNWYDSLMRDCEDPRERAQRLRDGFQVITGKGNHNPGMHSPMRTAVLAALKKDGWKVESGTGYYQVVGRDRK